MGCTVTHSAAVPTNATTNNQQPHQQQQRQQGFWGMYSRDSSTESGTVVTETHPTEPQVNSQYNGQVSSSTEPRQLEPRRISAITQFCINRSRAKSITGVELLSVDEGVGKTGNCEKMKDGEAQPHA